MTTTDTTTTVELAALTRAIEGLDADAIAARYAEGATLTLLDRDHPPSSPQLISGRDAIRTYFRDVCGRNVNHEVRDAVATDGGIAFTQHCRYPDGTRVVCAAVATLERGLIVRQTIVQTWD
ncbi:nuclear transport factor 2 family protein [Cellulomonas sp. McL0617]|uniref:nuclear transport factor 2 family protein n=1 Tax=Cellulomonas sp. McL0617 TaxID=3415675 RepID=UPI003CEA5334